METWAIVTLVLGSSGISALLTFIITKMQVSDSDKRLEKQLEKEIVIDYKERRREVRSEPLLKLRHELARMGNKLDKLVAAATRQHTRFDITEDEAKMELQQAVEDWDTYFKTGDFAQALLTQYDTELVNQAEEIRKDYQQSYFYQVHYQQIDGTKLLEAMKVFERNRNKIVGVQELINKRLEEL